MGSTARILPNYTYDDYCRWKGRWELIDGIPHAMSPMPTPRHQAIANEIGMALNLEVKKKHCNCKVYQPIDVKIAENTIVNPDILVVCKPIKKKFLDFPPDLVVEILSSSTRLKDRITKMDLYQNFGIKYYLIVDPDSDEIEVYTLEGGKYLLQKDHTFYLQDECKIKPDFSNIWNR